MHTSTPDAELVRCVLRELGWSQRLLAKVLCRNHMTVWRYLHGRVRPPKMVRQRLVELLTAWETGQGQPWLAPLSPEAAGMIYTKAGCAGFKRWAAIVGETEPWVHRSKHPRFGGKKETP